MSDANARPSSPQGAAESAFNVAYPAKLRAGERRLLEGRRQKAKVPGSAERPVGFGLSGGGIRSATFALGLFQGMARKAGLLRQIDFLSTVSGGGYFGSFFGRLLTREYVETPEDVEKILLGDEKPQILDFLRENGRYLSPNGAGDALLFGAAVFRNWVSVHVVMSLFVLALFLALQCLRVGLELALGGRGLATSANSALIWWSPFAALPLVAFVFAAIPPVAALGLVFVVSLWLAVITRDQAVAAAFWGSLAAVSLLTFGVWKITRSRLPHKRPMEAPLPDRRGSGARRTAVDGTSG